MDSYQKKVASRLSISPLSKGELVELVDRLSFLVSLERFNSFSADVEEIRSHKIEIVAEALKTLL